MLAAGRDKVLDTMSHLVASSCIKLILFPLPIVDIRYLEVTVQVEGEHMTEELKFPKKMLDFQVSCYTS